MLYRYDGTPYALRAGARIVWRKRDHLVVFTDEKCNPVKRDRESGDNLEIYPVSDPVEFAAIAKCIAAIADCLVKLAADGEAVVFELVKDPAREPRLE